MAITWTKLIPRWSGDTIEPPEAKKDVGYIAGDKPPAKWENWLRKGTYEALDETRDVIENIDSQLAQIELEFDNHETSGVHQNVSVTNTADATSATNAPLKSAGGLAVAKKVFIGGELNIDTIPINISRKHDAGGVGIVSTDFYGNNTPILADLYVVEKETNKYLRAVAFKADSASAPVVTVLASNGLTIGAVNAQGTISISGATVSANVKMVAVINGVGTQL